MDIYYTYDAQGYLVMISTLKNEYMTNYYVAINSRGDVEKIYDTSKNMVAYYKYDSWGKVVGIYDESNKEITSSEHIGKINPIRYRGYYYDEET